MLHLTVDDVGCFTAEVYQESNPLVRAAFRTMMTPGLSWRFRHWVTDSAGTGQVVTYLGQYREYGGAVYGYDEASSSDGQGQRTSMHNAADSAQWQYDARGRVTVETTTAT